jgi:hypothetical protein
MTNYSVIKNPNGGWDAKRDESSKASSHSDTQSSAELDAKRFSANSGGGEVRIHGLDGKIRDSDTVPPGHDPFPPRDKRH